MPIISAARNYLTVINLFTTDMPDKQDRLLGAMREIVDAAAYPGWISSTVHSGQAKLGTANVIQWRSGEDLEARYAGEEFKHRTLPLFTEMTTSIKLLQTEVVFTQRRSPDGDDVEISPNRDDYTVIEVFGVTPIDQDELVAVLGESQDWLLETPGYRSHSVLRGIRARGVEGAFVVAYSQWDDKASYDAFRTLPEDKQPDGRRKTQARLSSLATSSEWNTYRVVHARAAESPGFDPLYAGDAPIVGMGMKLDFLPWDIGGPQPAVVAIERAGGFSGAVFDAGSGLGENAIYLASRGYRVTGVDGSPSAVEQAKERARARGVDVAFTVGDVARLDGVEGGFTTALDWGTYHSLKEEQRRPYAAAVHRVCEPGARWHMLCFTESTGPNLPMNWLRVSHDNLRANLDGYWRVLSIEETTTTTRLTREFLNEQRNLPFDPDTLDVDEQGRILYPISHVQAERI